MKHPKKIKIPYGILRRISQILFLLLFLFLFRKTDYAGTDIIPYAVNIFFRWDPLVAASVIIITRQIIDLFLPAVFIIIITLIFGRIFCAWLCPLGTLLDCAKISPHPNGLSQRAKEKIRTLPQLKYVFLVLILVSSIFGLQLVGYFDPFSILVRSLTFSVDTVFNYAVTSFFDLIYKHAPEWITGISEPVYSFLKSTILPYKQSFFSLTLLSFLILIGILALEKIEKRFWCKNLCPLGALLSLFSRFSLLKRYPVKQCSNCSKCSEICSMNAFNASGYILSEECNLCFDCVDACPKGNVSFKFTPLYPPFVRGEGKRGDIKELGKKGEIAKKPPINLSRRVFVTTTLSGMALPFISKINVRGNIHNPLLIRPPGALVENEFLARCVRCGECMKVCLTNGLQPAFLDSGWEGMFTPVLIPQQGYCEYNCTLCGQVCPTGAIKKLSLQEKQKFVIGKAVINKDYCLPYKEGTPCMVCEEHCPVYDKAIKFEEVFITDKKGKKVKLKRPYVVYDLCTGCGICENKCPVAETRAIKVLATQTDKILY